MLDHDAASQPEGVSQDDVLDNVTLYWPINTGIASNRLYWESKLNFFAPKHVTIPVSVGVFSDELYTDQRGWAEQSDPRLTICNRRPKGGHFILWGPSKPAAYTLLWTLHAMNVPTRVVIADDHAIIRAALRALLTSHEDLAVVGEACDGAEAIALWQETRPDVGLFDLRMPALDGVEALCRIREQQPQAAVIMLTALAREVDIERAVGAGARAYLLKDATISEIVACIRSVRTGDLREVDCMKRRLSNRATTEPLTQREAEVLESIACGRSNRCIAQTLGIGEGTVKTHLKRIYGKLCARNRTEAVAVARRKGLL